MGLLDRFKQFITEDEHSDYVIYAPISGEIVPIESISDVVFSEKILGDGVAIKSSSGRVVAPISGKLTQLFSESHAFMIENENLTLFIYFGIGATFNKEQTITHCQVGDNVEIGELIFEVDLSFFDEHNEPLFTPIIVTNLDLIVDLVKLKGDVIEKQSPIMLIKNV